MPFKHLLQTKLVFLCLISFPNLQAQTAKDLVERTILHLGNNDLQALKETCFMNLSELEKFVLKDEDVVDPKNLTQFHQSRVANFERTYGIIQKFATDHGIDWKEIKLLSITKEKEINQMEIGTKQDIEFTFKYNGTRYSMELDDCIRTDVRGWIISDRMNDLEVVE